MSEASRNKAAVIADRLRSLGPLLLIVLQLVLLAVVIRQFQIESPAFVRLAMLAFVGFAINAFLPLSWRPLFFVALSIAAILMVLGTASGAWLIGLGLVLIAICHLPMRLRYRVALLAGVGALLALQRAGIIDSPWSQAVWPILGSMFMFRLIVYLYDLNHETVPVSPSRTLGYFFLLPNVCFPLFPVVDYKAFRRNYYDDEATRIYQIGVNWMVRGVIHLILYRVVYYYLVLAPSEVHNIGTFTQFVVANFLLYLRISGQFHIIVGMLYLFGFRLPETHHKYFLSSSFTDFWRRINIYWKDFMLKIFYYPLYFRLKSFGPMRALVVSTFLVFFATWALHTYQWFWLRGKVLLAWTDAAFWAILAVLVVVNAVYEMRHGRVRSLGHSRWSWQELGGKGLRVAGTFASISILWSLWTSESFSAWFSIWGALGETRPAAAGWIPGIIIASVVAVSDAVKPTSRPPKRPPGGFWSNTRWSTVTTLISLLLMAALGVQGIHIMLGPKMATVINSLRSGQLSRVDNAMLERGYYEDLVRVDRFNNQLWEVYMNKPANWLDVTGLGLEQFRDDFLQKELIPSRKAQTRFGPIQTNRWGMRDRDYERQPPPGTYRIALLGASTVMGWGVGDSEAFEAIVEDRLNRERPSVNYARYEILNFAVPGYEPLQQLVVLEKAWEFSPNAVIHVAAGREVFGAVQNLATAVRKGVPIPYEFLRDVARRAGIDAKTDETTALRRLQPFGGELLAWVYGQMAAACKQHNAVPILVFLPHIYPGIWEQEADEVIVRAKAAGFVVLDLKRIYQGIDPAVLRLAEWDAHPNAGGHQIIAQKLYDAIVQNTSTIFIPRANRP